MSVMPLPAMAPTRCDRPALIVGRLRITCLLSADETGGSYSLFDMITPPHDGGPPPHTHTLEDEAFYVLEGEHTVVIDGQEIKGGPGSWMFAPRFKPHGFRNDGDVPCRVLLITSPGGFEKFFEACAIPAPANMDDTYMPGPPTEHQIRLILDAMPKYGMTAHV
jgi:mannose-6-phosphate isomerase-like protein (cupin superfamily)